jgi:hypothetical protein
MDSLPAASPAERVFALLEGTWSIERTITPGGTYAGTAEFTSVTDTVLAYHEAGNLSLPNGKRLHGERRYKYELHDAVIEVSFADGMNSGQHFIFIDFPQSQENVWPIESAEDTHICRLDKYIASLSFESEDVLVITYLVSGPKKGYVSRSTYTRTR